ncbi:hypothetical protein CEW92_15325 [Bacillaceae bacterium SAS-127]|nr:hypothetical protein CEW92_15325 [Bacillaceae bacterium SAS-127]
MRKKIFTLILMTVLIFPLPLNNIEAAGGNDGLTYHYKGSGTNRDLTGTNGAFLGTEDEVVSFTIQQYFNPKTARGRAKIKVYSRAGIVKRILGSNYKVAVVELTSGLADADSRGSLFITGLDPVQSSVTSIPQWSYNLVATFLPYGGVISTFTNGIRSGVDHVASSSAKKSVVAFNGYGIPIATIEAPTSVGHTNLESWAHSQGKKTGFTGMFLYDIGSSSQNNYKLRAFAKAKYKASSNDFYTSFPLTSLQGTAVHTVNSK